MSYYYNLGHSPFSPDVRQAPVQRDQVADVLVEGVLLPPLLHQLLLLFRQVGETDGPAQFAQTIGFSGGRDDTTTCQISIRYLNAK